jgi:amidase
LVENLEAGLAMSPADLAWAAAEQGRIARDFQRVFLSHDVVITPAVNVRPFAHNRSHPTMIDGRPARHYAEWYSLSYAVTTVGHPAIAIPAGLDGAGTPFGVQVVGRRHEDRRLLEVALALEELFDSISEMRRPRPNLDRLATQPRLRATERTN